MAARASGSRATVKVGAAAVAAKAAGSAYGNPNDVSGNAVQHCVYACLSCEFAGLKTSKLFLEAHEFGDPHNTPLEFCMDMWNNGQGWDCCSGKGDNLSSLTELLIYGSTNHPFGDNGDELELSSRCTSCCLGKLSTGDLSYYTFAQQNNVIATPDKSLSGGCGVPPKDGLPEPWPDFSFIIASDEEAVTLYDALLAGLGIGGYDG